MRPVAGDYGPGVVYPRASSGARVRVSSTAVRGRWVGSRRGALCTGSEGNAARHRDRGASWCD